MKLSEVFGTTQHLLYGRRRECTCDRQVELDLTDRGASGWFGLNCEVHDREPQSMWEPMTACGFCGHRGHKKEECPHRPLTD